MRRYGNTLLKPLKKAGIAQTCHSAFDAESNVFNKSEIPAPAGMTFLKIFSKVSIFLFFILIIPLWAQTEAGFAFLKLPVDARSAAMGEAATAYAQDASAVYWNPALLSGNDSKSLVLMHNAYLADIAQEFVAFQFLTGKNNMAVSLNLINIPGIEIRGERPTEEPAGKTEAINLAAAISYARPMKNNWAVGLSLKYLYEKYYLQDASGYAIDLGVSKTNLFNKPMTFGLTLQNLGKMKPLQTEATKLPLLLRTGLAYQTPVRLFNKPIETALDVDYLVNENKLRLHTGLEVPLFSSLHGRAGLLHDSDRLRYTLGFGLNYKQYQLHYAFSPYPYNLGYAHRFSLHWRF